MSMNNSEYTEKGTCFLSRIGTCGVNCETVDKTVFVGSSNMAIDDDYPLKGFNEAQVSRRMK